MMKISEKVKRFLARRVAIYEGRYCYASDEVISDRRNLEVKTYNDAVKFGCEKMYYDIATKYKLMNPKKALSIAIERYERAVSR